MLRAFDKRLIDIALVELRIADQRDEAPPIMVVDLGLVAI